MAEPEKLVIYEILNPDGTITEIEGPEGASESELSKFAEESYSRSTYSGTAGAVIRGAALPATAALGGFLVGNVPGALAGAGAAAFTQLVADPVVSSVNSLLGTNYQLPTDALSDFFDRLGVPEPRSEAEKVLQTAMESAASATSPISLGKVLMQSGKPVIRQIGSVLSIQPEAQVAGAFGGGAASEAAEQAGFPESVQFVAGMAGGQMAATRAIPRVQQVASQLPSDLEEAARRGVTVTTTDVIPPRTFFGKWVQSQAEKTPVIGTAGVRSRQAEERITAINNLLEDYNVTANLDLTDRVAQAVLSNRSAKLTKYNDLKNQVKDNLRDIGIVPIDRTIKMVDDEIKEYSMRGPDYAPYVARLKDWRETASLSNGSIDQVEQLRKDLGKAFTDPELAKTLDTSQKFFNRLYGSLRQDISDFVSKNGTSQDRTKWVIANKELSKLAEEVGVSSWRSAINKGEVSPENISRFLFSGKPSEIRRLYNSLDESGRQTARMAILSRAAAKASTDTGEISPEKFVKIIKGLDPSINVFFSGNDLNRIKGLARIINYTKRASQAGAVPKTGEQLTPYGMLLTAGGSYFYDPSVGMAALGTLGGTAGLARFYESAVVRDLMIKLGRSGIKPDEEAALLKRFISEAQRYAGEQQEPMEEVVVTAER